jgi:hypothetical protein
LGVLAGKGGKKRRGEDLLQDLLGLLPSLASIS